MRLRVTLIILLQFILIGLANAGNLSPEQQEIYKLIQKIYSIDPHTFEFGDFNGRYQPKKWVEFMKSYFDDAAVKHYAELLKKSPGADVPFFRYPGEELVNDMGDVDDLPKVTIKPAVVNGSDAKVIVITGDKNYEHGHVVYFLHKTDRGWRIVNALGMKYTFSDNDTGVNVLFCNGGSLLPLTPEQDKEVPSDCGKPHKTTRYPE
jgi:hypothetical protein